VTPTDQTQDVDHLRDRVRLYLQVMLFVDLYGYVDDFVAPLLVEGLEVPQLPFAAAVLRHLATALLIGGWLLTKIASTGRLVVVVIESTVTIALTFVYVHIALAYLGEVMPSYGPVFSLIGILLLLVVRASLVPSTAIRTVAMGVASLGVWLFFNKPVLDGLDPIAFDGLTFIGVAFIVATTVTSRVIYGLRRQVREAMRLGQYELGRKLGEGGMGEVYEATHVMLRRPTAVKLLPPDRLGEQAVTRFEREVRETSRLQHPNSIEIYDYGRTPDGLFYYAMELLDGVTLAQLVEDTGPLPASRAVHVLRQAAGALAEAHGKGLVHRDIKPANIMLCERAGIPDTVKVLDYGLVKEVANPEVGEGITRGDTIVGTPQYLAPEAITRPEEVGPAADVYALGAVGFYLVTGREVFTASSIIELCSQHLTATPESPSAVLGEPIDPDFEALILKCLAKDPDARPADGAVLAQELDELTVGAWSPEDARTWWDEHRRARPDPSAAPMPTQLAVDVAGR